MSWLADRLPLAPSLVITGPESEADLLLRVLSFLCRCPLLLAGVSAGTLRVLPTEALVPTLLIRETELSRSVAALLATSSSPGYFVATSGGMRDLYCAKAIYLGDQAGGQGLGQNTIHIGLVSALGTAPKRARLLSKRIALDFQNMFLAYRLANYSKVADSDFEARDFTSDIRALAQVLGAAIVGDPELQGDIISLLAPVDEQVRAEHASTLEALVIEAVLSFCHGGKKQTVFVREIAETVNHICNERGETLKASAEKVGHTLKKLGLFTRRLGNGGRGLELGKDTQVAVHELVHAHQVASVMNEELACAYCRSHGVTEMKEVVNVV